MDSAVALSDHAGRLSRPAGSPGLDQETVVPMRTSASPATNRPTAAYPSPASARPWRPTPSNMTFTSYVGSPMRRARAPTTSGMRSRR